MNFKNYINKINNKLDKNFNCYYYYKIQLILFIVHI